jgi:hypothetical protein
MGSGGVFPAGMSEEPSQPIEPLDADTAERLLSGRLDPDDAPPGYAEVTRLLRTAAAPADPAELAGEAAAMAAFRMAQRPPRPAGRLRKSWGCSGEASGRPRAASGRRARSSARRGRVRGRLAALALAGAVAVAGVGVWTAGGAPFPGERRSPSGGPSASGPGSGTPASAAYGSAAYGSGAYGSGVGGAGSLRPASPGPGSAPGPVSVTNGRPPSLPSARERATARPGAGETSRGGASPHGTKPPRPAKPPKPKPPKPKPPKAQKPSGEGSRAEAP